MAKRSNRRPIFLVGKVGLVVLSLLLLNPGKGNASGPGDLAQIGLAFLTSLAVHESGHAFIADQVADAENVNVKFFTKADNGFAFGLTEASNLDQESRLPFAMGGEIANSFNFEYALAHYRQKPTTYNKSLLFFSGTDFLWYTVYSFALNGGAGHSDPQMIQEETDLSQGTIFAVALTQSLLNLNRVVTGRDTFVPYFTFNRDSVNFMVRMSGW